MNIKLAGQGDGSPVSLSTQLSSYQVNAGSYNLNLSYTYDSNGNITSVSDGTYTVSYAYDSQNQLIRENNQKLNKTWTWAYDGAGNILSRTEYTYTTGTLGTPLSTKSYTYGGSDWGDLLASFNGNAITYDEIGNMLTYGSRTFTWEHGRQLSAVDNLGMGYDKNGIRLGKYDRSTEICSTYCYRENLLIQMNFYNNELYGDFYFHYDANGTLLSADYLVEHWTVDYYWDENGNLEYIDFVDCVEYSGTFQGTRGQFSCLLIFDKNRTI